jgi:hypothetical protein
MAPSNFRAALGAGFVERQADLRRALGLGDDHPEIGHAEVAQHDRQIGAPDLDQGRADVAHIRLDSNMASRCQAQWRTT